MGPGVLIPLACFAAVVIIIALVCFAKLHDVETQIYYRLRESEREHHEAMERLNGELMRLRHKPERS